MAEVDNLFWQEDNYYFTNFSDLFLTNNKLIGQTEMYNLSILLKIGLSRDDSPYIL